MSYREKRNSGHIVNQWRNIANYLEEKRSLNNTLEEGRDQTRISACGVAVKVTLLVVILFVCRLNPAHAADCNNNGIDDSQDIAASSFSFTRRDLPIGTRVDLNGDGLIDSFTRTPSGFRVDIQQADNSFRSVDYPGRPSGRSDRGPFTYAASCNPNGFLDLVQGNSFPFRFENEAVEFLLYRNDGFGNFGPQEVANNRECTMVVLENPDNTRSREPFLFSPDVFEDRFEQLDSNSFELFVTVDGNTETSVGTYTLPEIDVQNASLFVDAIDFDRDGFRDLVVYRVTSEQNVVYTRPASYEGFIFAGTSDGKIDQQSRIQFFDRRDLLDVDGISTILIFPVDVNHDGFTDFAIREGVRETPPSTAGVATASYALLNAGDAEFIDVNRNEVPDVCERAIPGDYDGDRRSNEVVVRPFGAGLDWYISNNQSNSPAPIQFGLSGFDHPAPGDFDGDQLFSPGVVRNIFGGLFWFYRTPDGEAVSRQWGLSGDIPLNGYFDADKTTDLAVVRNQDGFLFWYITPFEGTEAQVVQWGLAGDTPFTADWNGDGVDELIVARNERGGITWYVRSLDGSLVEVIQWGLSGDTLLKPADMDGDGKADLLVSRPSGILASTFTRFADGTSDVKTFGLASDRRFIGYYSGGHTGELGVYRLIPFSVSQHYVSRTPSTRFRLFGLADDIFVPPSGL